MKKITYLTVLFALVVSISGCKKNTAADIISKFKSGYNYLTEDVSKVPTSLDPKHLTSNSTSLPASVDLTPYFPPVGDQGQYGTCIGWATAYNMKSALEAINKGYSTSQLTQPGYQLSPKDLFLAIDDNKKGANCEGTNFDVALSVVQSRGVATMQTVPYNNLGNCAHSSSEASWATDAANHQITSFRKVDPDVDAIKQNLANKSPVLIGIGVGTGFQNWRGSGVMENGFDPCGGGGDCGGHAQCIIGYDDSKGSHGAFRIVNSWDPTAWGDNGYYWVAYDFLLSTLAQRDQGGNYCIFVATNGTTNPPNVNPPTPSGTGVDLASWVEEDLGANDGTADRRLVYNIYNIGNSTAAATSNWGLYYVYYNAYNANDYGVIFADEFTSSVSPGSIDCSSGTGCQLNFDIAAGDDFANAAFSDVILHQDYTMPAISGDYYLILVADAGQVLGDINYDNNLFYTSDLPKTFSSGISSKNGPSVASVNFKNSLTANREVLRKNVFNTAVSKMNRNAYRPDEIMGFLKKKKASGELYAKVRQYIATNGSKERSITPGR